MRILHIVGSISPEAGGTTEAVRMLIHYAPAGISSELVTLDDPTSPFLAAVPCPVHALGQDRRWYSPKLMPWLRANRNRFDGVMIHGLWEFTGLAAAHVFSGHVPYVVFPHGMLDPYFKRAFPAKHLKKWLLWLTGVFWMLRSAHRVLFTTAVERDLARHSFWLNQWRPMVVALGAEPPSHDPIAAESAFFQRCPQVQGKRFLLFLGRIDPKKGCDLLIDAFAATANLDPDLHLVMAGPDPGKWRDQLNGFAELGGVAHRIHWPGMTKGEAKTGAFYACDAFILPSHQENFGIAVVEALSCGKPVLITTPVNIAPDVSGDGCALVEPDTVAGVTRLLERWIALPAEVRASMSRQALLTFAARYDMRRNAETILRVFDRPQQAASDAQPKALAEAR